jgi:hypothetical protein
MAKSSGCHKVKTLSDKAFADIVTATLEKTVTGNE